MPPALAGGVFTINAGHTFKQANKDDKLYIHLPNKSHRIIPQPIFIVDNEKMDIAISVVLPEDVRSILDAGSDFFDLEAKEYTNLPEFNHLIFTGCPSSQYKPLANTPRAKFIRYETKEVIRPPDYPQEFVNKVDTEYHIMGVGGSRKLPSTDDQGKTTLVDLPRLAGMSGGPVFWYDPEITHRPYFAGIGIKNFDRQQQIYLIALKAEAIIAALHKALGI